jgi:hypothetical protein
MPVYKAGGLRKLISKRMLYYFIETSKVTAKTWGLRKINYY